jgi:hypothetical protein
MLLATEYVCGLWFGSDGPVLALVPGQVQGIVAGCDQLILTAVRRCGNSLAGRNADACLAVWPRHLGSLDRAPDALGEE